MAAKTRYTPSHMRDTYVSPSSHRSPDNSTGIGSYHSTPPDKMQKENYNSPPLRKLSPKGNRRWCNYLDEDTLPDPMPDIVMDSLTDNTNEFHSHKAKMHSNTDTWETGRETLDRQEEENYIPPLTMNLMFNNMMVKPTTAHENLMDLQRSEAVAKHNALIHNPATNNVEKSGIKSSGQEIGRSRAENVPSLSVNNIKGK
jgi:hypothetical protein